MRKIKVLHILDMLTTSSGVASVVMGAIKNFDAEAFQIDIAIYKDSDIELIKNVTSCGGQVFQLPNIALPFGTKYKKAYVQLLCKNQYDIVHGHLANSAFISMRQAKLLGVSNRILHSHNPFGADTTLKRVRNRVLDYNATRWANHYFACSRPAAEYLFRGNSEKAVILANAIDSSRFAYNESLRAEVRHQLGISDDILCIGHIGRFAPQKNHVFLLDAFAMLHSTSPNSRLVMVGDGPLLDDIKGKASALGLSEAVIFLGKRSDSERLFQAFDLFWFPSIFEGYGIAALEAQCAGLPCFLSQSMIKNNVAVTANAHFLSTDDPESWCEASLKISKGFNRIDQSDILRKAHLDVKTQTAQLQDLYKEMVQ